MWNNVSYTTDLERATSLLNKINKEIEEYNNSNIIDNELEELLEFEQEFSLQWVNSLLPEKYKVVL